MDWLDVCIAVSVIGAVLVVFLRRWLKIWTILQPMWQGRYLKKSTKPCWPKNLDEVYAANIIKPTQTLIYQECITASGS